MSNFIHYDLGNLSSSNVVEVEIDNQAYVRLLNETNFSMYRSGKRYQFSGGLQKKSVKQYVIPNADHWHVAIDFGGRAGSIKTDVRVVL